MDELGSWRESQHGQALGVSTGNVKNMKQLQTGRYITGGEGFLKEGVTSKGGGKPIVGKITDYPGGARNRPWLPNVL